MCELLKRVLSRLRRSVEYLRTFKCTSEPAEMATTETEYRSWASDKQTVLADLSVELQEATETHLQLLVNGGSKLQILIPSTYHLGLSASTDSSEVFLVLTMGDINGKVESSMMALNERLEQIRVNKDVLQKVLDLLLGALQKLHEHRGAKRSRHKFENDVESERPAGSDWEDEEEGDDDQTSSEGCNSEENYQSDDEGDVNASCYDIAVGESRTSCTTEYETRTGGFLHALADDARKLCEDYQRGSSRDMKHPLMWVRVVSKPMLLTVQLQFEVAGMIDERIAAGLGLTLDEPVSLSLEFSKNVWSESIFRSERLLKYERVSASQCSLVSNVAPEKDPDDIDRFLEASGGDRHRSYGLEVLFPELTKKFFANLNQESPSDNVHLEGFDYEKFNSKNPFVCLALFISLQLRLLPGWCLVCWKKLPFSVTRMRTCDDDLCLYRFEELGLGVSVLDEVKSNAALVDVDISLAYSAVESSRDVFEPFPAFLLANQEIRGRSGWFSNSHRPNSLVKDAGKTNKRFDILKHVLSGIPAIDVLKECANERSLKRALTRAWYVHKYEGFERAPHGGPVVEHPVEDLKRQSTSPFYRSTAVVEPADPELWKKVAKMAYDVTRFILMTNRLSLSLLSREDEVMKPEMFSDRADHYSDVLHAEFTHYQFVVLHDTPEKEAYFTRRREAHGSFFAFHGSSPENWYSILRNGLRSMSNTGYMSTGAAYGEGIYLATDLSTSMNYARPTGTSWGNGKLKNGFHCIAICEVINGSPRASPRSNNILVVPRENEKNVAIRYLLVFKPKVTAFVRDVRIEGRALCAYPSNIDLLHHYQRLQQSQGAAQRLQRQTRMAARSAIFLRALAADESHVNVKPAVVVAPPPTVAAPSSAKNKAPARHETQGRSAGIATRTRSGASAGTLSSQAVMQEFSSLMKAIRKSPPIAPIIERNEPAAVLAGTTVTIPDEDNNLSLWRIALHPYLLKESTHLYNDFKELKRLRNAADDIPVELEVKFPSTFPFEPPFVRVVSPRFKMHSGHVTVGGSICMELLTASGWSPACNFESLLVQVVMAFVEGEGRLDLKKASVHGKHEYQESEAREAFQRAARAHGWKTS